MHSTIWIPTQENNDNRHDRQKSQDCSKKAQCHYIGNATTRVNISTRCKKEHRIRRGKKYQQCSENSYEVILVDSKVRATREKVIIFEASTWKNELTMCIAQPNPSSSAATGRRRNGTQTEVKSMSRNEGHSTFTPIPSLPQLLFLPGCRAPSLKVKVIQVDAKI